MIKIRTKELLHYLIIIYPLTNLIAACLFGGDNMNTYSWLYCMILCCFMIQEKKWKTTVVTLVGTLWLFFLVGIAFMREESRVFATNSLMAMGTVLYLFLFAEKSAAEVIDPDMIIARKREFCLTQIGYIMILLFWVYDNGLRAGWNTYVLQGPYNYPHTLSYILLLFLMCDMFYFLKSKKKYYLILSAITITLIILTAVRTALIPLVFIIIYVLKELLKGKQIKPLFFAIAASIIAAFVIWKFGWLDSVMEKSQLAIAHGSFSNGRLNIAFNTLKSFTTYKGSKLSSYLIGVGLSVLLQNNYYQMGARIHAHNDLVDMLVIYGVIGFIIYIYAFWHFSENARWWIVFSMGILAIGNGLYMYIDCIPMLVFSRLLFESGNKLRTGMLYSLSDRKGSRRYYE